MNNVYIVKFYISGKLILFFNYKLKLHIYVCSCLLGWTIRFNFRLKRYNFYKDKKSHNDLIKIFNTNFVKNIYDQSVKSFIFELE
jgi:hypothetical protein